MNELYLKLGKNILLLSLLGASVALSADRKVYFTGTSINNYAYDSTATYYMSQNVALMCSVQVVNLSNTTQRVLDMGMYNHSTFYDNTTSTGGAYSSGVDLRGNGHTAYIGKDTTAINVAFVKVTLEANPGNWASYYNDGFTNYAATPFGAGMTLAGSGSSVDLEPNTMVYFIARSHAKTGAFTNTVDALSVAERKLYNFCNGFISVRDIPTAGQPKTGFVLATGFSEYVADSPIAKKMWFGEASDSWIGGMHDNTRSVNKVSTGTSQTLYVYFPNAVSCYGSTKCLPYATIQDQSVCNVMHYTNNASWYSVPQHIASVPILVNAGKPF